jgi:hypothetical protein
MVKPAPDKPLLNHRHWRNHGSLLLGFFLARLVGGPLTRGDFVEGALFRIYPDTWE